MDGSLSPPEPQPGFMGTCVAWTVARTTVFDPPNSHPGAASPTFELVKDRLSRVFACPGYVGAVSQQTVRLRQLRRWMLVFSRWRSFTLLGPALEPHLCYCASLYQAFISVSHRLPHQPISPLWCFLTSTLSVALQSLSV